MLKMLIERKLIVIILSVIILISGTISTLSLPIRLLPEVKENVLLASVVLKHEMDLDEVEKKVAVPIENALIHSPHVKKIEVRTTTKTISAIVTIKDTAKAEQQDEVKRELEKQLNTLAVETESKSVMDFSSDDAPFLHIAIVPEHIEDELTRTEIKHTVIPALKSIKDVKKVEDDLELHETEYVLEIKPHQVKGIQSTQLLLSEIRQIFAASMLGSLRYHGESYQVRAESLVASWEELHQYRLQNGAYITDVVELKQDQRAKEHIVGVNDKLSYYVQVFTAKNVSEVQVSKEVKKALQRLHEEKTTDWNYFIIWDNAYFMGKAVNELAINVVLGAILAAVILLLIFRGLRTMLVIAISIPICLMSTMLMMDYLDFTLNIISMIGLAIGTGMIVDACIVVLDNIFRKLQEGTPRLEAVLHGAKEVFAPVLSSVLTTVAVFLPIGFLDGIIGSMMKQLAFTVTVSLISSLLVAFIVVPILSLNFIRIDDRKSDFAQRTIAKMTQLINYALDRKMRFIAGFVAALILSLAVLIMFVPKGFIAETSDRSMAIRFDFDQNTPFEFVEDLVLASTRKLVQIDGVKDVFYEYSTDGTKWFHLYFDDKSVVPREDEEIQEDVLAVFTESLPVTEYSISFGQMGDSADTVIKVSSASFDSLMRTVPMITEELKMYPNVTKVNTTMSEDKQGWVLQFDHSQLNHYGYSRQEVENYVSTILKDSEIIDVRLNGEKTKIRIDFPGQYRKSSDAIYSLPLDEYRIVTLKDVAKVAKEPIVLQRTRIDGQYEVLIQVSHDPAYKAQLMPYFQRLLQQYTDGEVQLSLGGRDSDQLEGFIRLLNTLGLSLLGIVLILIIQFNSMRQPFIIFISLLFTVIGVSFGFFIMGRTFDIMAMIGVVMLAGIVINNSIVLIDFINKNRSEYDTLRAAILSAVHGRIRPIFTTTLTTISGLIPMFIGGTETSDFQTPIATTVIFGLSFSTLVSLVLVPILYELFEGRRERKHHALPNKKGPHSQVVQST